MRTIGAALLACTLVATSAFGATTSVAPLAPGKPAGAKEAANMGPNFAIILLGAGIVIGGIVLAVSNNGGDGVNSSTTTTTSATGLP